jgi:hypothetical protein
MREGEKPMPWRTAWAFASALEASIWGVVSMGEMGDKREIVY